MNKQRLVLFMITLFVSCALLPPVQAMCEVTEIYQFDCKFDTLINAINRTNAEMKLNVEKNFAGEENAYYLLYEKVKWTSSHYPVHYKVEVFKEDKLFTLRLTLESQTYALTQKSYHKKRAKEYIDNLIRFTDQTNNTSETRVKCPACKENIEVNAIICKNCKSFIGKVKSPIITKVTNEKLNQVDVFWKDESNNEEGFYIERKNADGEYVKIGNVNKNTEFYSDTSVVSGQIYYYRIKAYNIECESDYSSEISITVQ